MARTPRWYQSGAVDALWTALRAGVKAPLACLPTGAGKSICASLIAQPAVKQWNGRVLILVHTKELVQQLSETIREEWGDPMCPLGVLSAGLGSKTIDQITVAGIQSAYRRACDIGRVDLILVDEAHSIPESGDGMYLSLIADLRVINPDLRILGLTATPYRMGKGMIYGDGKIFSDLVYDAGIKQLIEQGFLSRLRSKDGGAPDLSGVHIRGGEFIASELEAAMSDEVKVKHAVDELMRHGSDRKAWLVFCCGVAHCALVSSEITGRGIDNAIITGETPDDERDALIAKYKARQLRCLININVLCLDSETEILTTSGWCRMDDMTYDHRIASWREDGHILFDPPKLIVRRDVKPGEHFVSVSGRNQNIRVTGNHRMIVRDGVGWIIKSADDIAGKDVIIPVSGQADPIQFAAETPIATAKVVAARIRSLSYVYRRQGMTIEDARRLAEVRASRMSAMSYKRVSDLTEDECLFIGFWIGDGTISCGRCSVSQSTAYPEIIKWFDALVARIGLCHSCKDYPARSKAVRNPKPSVRWSFARGTGGRSQYRHGYFHIEPYLTKDGGTWMWGLSSDQFAALLHGFWLADGNHGQGSGNTSGGIGVAGTQKALYDWIQAVGSCRGYKVTVTPLAQPGNPRHSPQWKISWRKAATSRLLVERLQIEPDAINEKSWCVTSTTGNIITRRRGKVAVVGNTTGFDAPHIDLIAMLRPTESPGLYYQMMGRGLRISPDKTDCLILDLAGNIQRHGPIDTLNQRISEPKQKDKPGVAPTKRCPECEEVIPAGVTACPVCGFEFPREQARHDTVADPTSPISDGTETGPKRMWEDVTDVQYEAWTKKGAQPGDPRTLCVTYFNGYNRVAREWVCVEHPVGSFASNKAVGWLERHADGFKVVPVVAENGVVLYLERQGEGVPLTADTITALGTKGRILRPVKIHLEEDGKFFKVIGHQFPEAGSDLDEPAYRAKCPIPDDDEPPF